MRKELILSNKYRVEILSIDKGYLLLNWPNRIEEGINKNILSFAEALRKKGTEAIIDIVPAYASIGIFYNYHRVSEREIISILENLELNLMTKKDSVFREIPVCYDMEFGIDLEALSLMHSMSKKEIIRLHVAAEYRVYFMGFLPGFMYLGGLNEQLHSPRKNTPRTHIPIGSVGIGGCQTGIYPIESPGGWNIIGRCPIKLFDLKKVNPCKFSAGDIIRFVDINKSEFSSIFKQENS